MNLIVVTALLLALIVYITVGLMIGRKARSIADLLPIIPSRKASVRSSSEFSASTVAMTISLATVIMAFFELASYYGIWLLWTVVTTAAGLVVVKLFASRIWRRLAAYEHRPTLHEFLGRQFDSKMLSKVGAVCTSLGFLGAFAVELTVGSKFFSALIPDIPAWIIVVVLSLAAFLYTSVGGFRAVIVTDRMQMISIWLLLISLPGFYLYYVLTHGGIAAGIERIPDGIFDFSYKPGLVAFLLGILAINVPSFISDMSVWQRIAGAHEDKTVSGGLLASIISVIATWSVFALLACCVFMIITPAEGVNPLLTLLKTISYSGGWVGRVTLFITVMGLYGAMLSTASTLLIAVSHTLYVDVFTHFGKFSLKEKLDSTRELHYSRLILIVTALLSIALVQLLSQAGFSIADLVFAVYGAQLGLCPLVISALVMDKKRLSCLSLWATAAITLGFITGWGSALLGRLNNDTNMVFLAPIWSLVISSCMVGIGIAYHKISGTWPLSVNWILVKSIATARRRGLYRLRPADVPARLVCLKDKCAICCKSIGTPVVTDAEAERIGADILMKDDNAMFIKSEDCTCSLLKNGLCSIYPVRPKGCREYPWYNIGGKLYYDAGCPGMKYDIDERPDVGDIQPFENFLPNTPQFIVRLIKKICVKNA